MRSFLEEKPSVALFDEVIVKSWWVILFFLLTYFAFDQALHRKNLEQENLQNKRASYLLEKKTQADEQARLQLEIDSQKDPAWIEMTLLRCLGLVPEGQTKIFFHQGK